MEHTYSPKHFGKLIGKSVNTLQKWDRKGILPALRSPTNRRYYTHEQYLQYRGLISSDQGKVIAYARVSSPSQKKDLATQKESLRAYCLSHGVKVDEWVEDVGSALNYKRKGFNQIIEQIELGQVKRLVLGYQDRFVRFGYDWFEAFCKRHGTEITVMNGEAFSPEEELVRDLLAIVSVFSARLHKVEQHGGQVIKVGRFFPSSKTCHCCGWKWEQMELSERIFLCQNPTCAYYQFPQDRDHNAGLAILQEALRLIGLIDQVVTDSGSGDDVNSAVDLT